MSMTYGSARLRGLAAELKELREKAGLNTREAARRAGFSSATLNRMELGTRAAHVADVSALLAVYQVSGVERERVLAMAREANSPGWWEAVGNGSGLPKQLPALISFESEARRIVHFALSRVPGLLQTSDYARVIMTSAGCRGADLESRVATRLGRQAVLTRAQPPAYLAILDEAVLRRPVGGPSVMAEQVHQIRRMAARPNVDVLVIPFDQRAYVGRGSGYALMEFAKARPVVMIESWRPAMFLDDPEDVTPFRQAVDALRGAALDAAESAEFLAMVADDYETRARRDESVHCPVA